MTSRRYTAREVPVLRTHRATYLTVLELLRVHLARSPRTDAFAFVCDRSALTPARVRSVMERYLGQLLVDLDVRNVRAAVLVTGRRAGATGRWMRASVHFES